MRKALYVVTIVLSAGFIIMGALILAGWLLPASPHSQLRVMMGIVFILYGVYRLVLTFARTGPTE